MIVVLVEIVFFVFISSVLVVVKHKWHLVQLIVFQSVKTGFSVLLKAYRKHIMAETIG